MVRNSGRMLGFLAAIAMTAVSVAAADRELSIDWPRWRGPHDDGSLAGGAYPEQLTDPGNLAWKVKLPGAGCSTPIVWADVIYLTGPADGHNAVLAYDRAGKELWRTPFTKERPGKHRNGSGANSSPITDGRRLFAYFKNGELAALDLQGKRLWSTNLQERFAKDTLYWDIGTSPILTATDVVVAVMHSGESYLAAFDQATGDLHWKVSRNYKTPVEGDHSYATPILLERGGKTSILVWGAERLTAHDPQDGHILWTCGGFNPDANANWVAVASAVVSGDRAIVPYGRGARVTAVKLDGSGDVTETHREWTRNDVSAFVPSPVVDAGKLYFVRDAGEVECLDPATGKSLWSDRFPKNRNKFYSSPLIAGGKLYAAREDGVVFVADVRDGFKLLSENDLGERTIASPVPLSGGQLLFRGEEHLWCIGSRNNGPR
jgi:outer membrane protein assembly factor BamB